MNKITIVLGFCIAMYLITLAPPDAPTRAEIDMHCEKVLLDNHTFVCQ